MNPLHYVIACVAAYFCGAVLPAIWLTRWVTGEDIRKVGSGNPGFTNALRVLGWKTAIGILLFDILKGFAPAFFFPQWLGIGEPANLTESAARLGVALIPVAGHVFSVFNRFRGGKGVATSLGVFLALSPLPMTIAVGVGLTVLALTRYMSLCSIIGAIVFAVAQPMLQRNDPLLTGASITIALLIIWRHRANMQRLLTGTELKIGSKKSENPISQFENGSHS